MTRVTLAPEDIAPASEVGIEVSQLRVVARGHIYISYSMALVDIWLPLAYRSKKQAKCTFRGWFQLLPLIAASPVGRFELLSIFWRSRRRPIL